MRRLGAVLALLLTAACSSQTDSADSDSNSSDVVTSQTLDANAVDAVLTKLAAQRAAAPIGPWYKDPTRLEGCWRNPAGDKLSDLQKTLYCSMPLELRLCNTVVLLTTDDAKRDERYRGFLDCQQKVDAVFGGKGLFVYGDDVNAMYKTLFLEGGTLASQDLSHVVSANKPAFTERPFTILLATIASGLVDEAAKLGLSALKSMIDEYVAAAQEQPR
jgi:hypothetical protein